MNVEHDLSISYLKNKKQCFIGFTTPRETSKQCLMFNWRSITYRPSWLSLIWNFWPWCPFYWPWCPSTFGLLQGQNCYSRHATCRSFVLDYNDCIQISIFLDQFLTSYSLQSNPLQSEVWTAVWIRHWAKKHCVLQSTRNRYPFSWFIYLHCFLVYYNAAFLFTHIPNIVNRGKL